MKDILFYTSNSRKFREVADVLAKSGIKATKRSIKFDERGDTIEQVVKNKARDAYTKVKKPLITEDTGVFFDAYKGFPGLYAKRIFDSIKYDGMLRLLDGKNRGAKFVTCICYTDGKLYKVFRGEWRGKIDTKVNRHPNVMAYERLFIPKGYDIPLCKVDRDEKNKISHRAKAAQRLADFLRR